MQIHFRDDRRKSQGDHKSKKAALWQPHFTKLTNSILAS